MIVSSEGARSTVQGGLTPQAGLGDNDAAGAAPETAERFRYERDELLAMSRALSSERDINKLLALILEKSRQITGADAGSVYIVEAPDDDGDGRPDKGDKLLHFVVSQNDSAAVNLKEFRLPIDEKSIVGRAVLDRRPISIPDLGRLGDPALPGAFRHNRAVDDKTGYRARSMLTVPMLSARNEVIGVVQLINKKRKPERRLGSAADFDTEVIPFDARSEEMALALASQAGVCLENAFLYKEITNLFEGFVDASVTAIEARDPTTSGHSRRVATLTVGLAERVDALSDGPFAGVCFTREDLRQIEYAGMLHDFGKVGVRENVLVKAKKLYDAQRAAIDLRFAFIRKAAEAEGLARKLELLIARGAADASEALAAIDRETAARVAAVGDAWGLLLAANEPTLMEQPVIDRIREIAAREYLDVGGVLRPWLLPEELEALQISRGSLTRGEREEIQSHVTHTIAFLDAIPWGRALRNVPRIAGGHHELLDGKGYPAGLRGDQIPIETRMLTISDIFDALTASDRPYKSAVPVPKALGIIDGECKAGRCDPSLFQIFVEAEVYRKVT